MRNQFIYTEEITKPGVQEDLENGIVGTDPYTETRKNSFNVDLVIRALSLDDGGVLLLLDDLHERWQDVPGMNRNGKRTIKREKDTFQSEIRITKEEGERFFELTDITKTDNE